MKTKDGDFEFPKDWGKSDIPFFNQEEKISALERENAELKTQASAASERIADLEIGLRIIQSRCNPSGCVTSDIWHIARHALSPISFRHAKGVSGFQAPEKVCAESKYAQPKTPTPLS